jgi:hypothetical protein
MEDMGLFNNSKVAVLESRMNSYDRYFEKLDESIEKLSEVSVGIKEMLIKHEGKLEERVLTEESLSARLIEIKKESHEEHEHLLGKINSMQSKIEELFKWRWIAAGAILVIGLFIGQVAPDAKSVPGAVLQQLIK